MVVVVYMVLDVAVMVHGEEMMMMVVVAFVAIVVEIWFD